MLDAGDSTVGPRRAWAESGKPKHTLFSGGEIMQGSHYENHQQAAELHNLAAHAHGAGEEHGKQEHLTGHERTRQTLEHSQESHGQTQTATVGHGIIAFGHEDIAVRAREIWEAKGCPEGTADEDWFQAVKELRLRT
jgi:hypothetical protein